MASLGRASMTLGPDGPSTTTSAMKVFSDKRMTRTSVTEPDSAATRLAVIW
jgi:hypothetical protein